MRRKELNSGIKENTYGLTAYITFGFNYFNFSNFFNYYIKSTKNNENSNSTRQPGISNH